MLEDKENLLGDVLIEVVLSVLVGWDEEEVEVVLKVLVGEVDTNLEIEAIQIDRANTTRVTIKTFKDLKQTQLH